MEFVDSNKETAKIFEKYLKECMKVFKDIQLLQIQIFTLLRKMSGDLPIKFPFVILMPNKNIKTYEKQNLCQENHLAFP